MDEVIKKLKELDERVEILETKIKGSKQNKVYTTFNENDSPESVDSKENIVYVLEIPNFLEESLKRTGNPDNIKFEIVEDLPEDSANPKAWVCPGI